MKCPKCGREFEPCSLCRGQYPHQQCINDDMCHDCKMQKQMIDKFVDRFLGWKLPNDFCPDGGIEFKHEIDARGYQPPWPVGTNLFSAVQARQMFEDVLAGERISDDGLEFNMKIVLDDVVRERKRQIMKWGGSDHDDNHSTAEFVQWIEDYAGWARMMASMNSTEKARNRLIQVAALAVAAVESMDRKDGCQA